MPKRRLCSVMDSDGTPAVRVAAPAPQASMHVLNENLGDMLLLFSVGVDMSKYEVEIDRLPADVLAMIARFVLGPLHLVRGGLSYLYDSGSSVNTRWLLRLMEITRKESDIPYGDAYYNKRAKHYAGPTLRGSFYPPDMAKARRFAAVPTPHPAWRRKQWEYFLHHRFEEMMTRADGTFPIIQHGTRPFLFRNIYDHATRFYVAGLGFSYRHQFMLYEPFINESEEASVAKQLREIMGTANFERFVRVRAVPGGMQIFFFGSAVDIDAVMGSDLFIRHSYFSGASALHYWYGSPCVEGWTPVPLHGGLQDGCRPVHISFK